MAGGQAPPLQRTRRRAALFAVPLLLAVLALAAWLAAGPWLAVRGIGRALETRDTTALERHVDFPRLRANLKAQLDDRLVRAAGDAAAHPLGALALAAAGGLAGATVDVMVTPTGIAGLLQGHALWQRSRGRTVDHDPWGATEPARPLHDARLRWESPSRFTATVVHPDGRRTVCVLQRQGLRWRLVDIRLPEEPVAPVF